MNGEADRHTFRDRSLITGRGLQHGRGGESSLTPTVKGFFIFFILFTSQYTSRSSSVIVICLDQRKGNNITYV